MSNWLTTLARRTEGRIEGFLDHDKPLEEQDTVLGAQPAAETQPGDLPPADTPAEDTPEETPDTPAQPADAPAETPATKSKR